MTQTKQYKVFGLPELAATLAIITTLVIAQFQFLSAKEAEALRISKLPAQNSTKFVPLLTDPAYEPEPQLVRHAKNVPHICLRYLTSEQIYNVDSWSVFKTKPENGYNAIGFYENGQESIWLNFDTDRTLTSTRLITQIADDGSKVVRHYNAAGKPEGRTVYQYRVYNGYWCLCSAEGFCGCGSRQVLFTCDRNANGQVRQSTLIKFDCRGTEINRISQLTPQLLGQYLDLGQLMAKCTPLNNLKGQQ
ncbi:MAG: hypothetical protein K2X29_10615 [Candidatus Obscuribacterales bacterium]|nr:hypothetical protein [Candidatus Obscuribacterales bacterium]